MKDARILILDEPTSPLDQETEAHLVDALHETAQHKPVIVRIVCLSLTPRALPMTKEKPMTREPEDDRE